MLVMPIDWKKHKLVINRNETCLFVTEENLTKKFIKVYGICACDESLTKLLQFDTDNTMKSLKIYPVNQYKSLSYLLNYDYLTFLNYLESGEF